MKDYSKPDMNSPFKVPEDYFETLGERIETRIQEEEAPRKEPLVQLLKPYIWMAASILVFVFVAKLILTNTIDPNYKIRQISQVDTQKVETEIPSQISEEDIYFDSAVETSSDEIIDYLSDEDIDTDILIANL